MNPQQIRNVVEAALMVAEQPMSVDRIVALFPPELGEPPTRDFLRTILQDLRQEYESRGIELHEVASGFRVQVRAELAPWVNRVWQERPPRYSRALLETLAIIAYRQPITRAEVEAIRGVAVSSQLIKTLLERDWIRIAGHRDSPGHPAVYATTRGFLDYFNLKTLTELPPLTEPREMREVDLEFLQRMQDSARDTSAVPDLEPAACSQQVGDLVEGKSVVGVGLS
ncbi:MAG: SMC-Scp complex subunit ScpB [Gammaproteobacteria bacterium]